MKKADYHFNHILRCPQRNMNSGNPAVTVTDLRGNFTLLSQLNSKIVCAKIRGMSSGDGMVEKD